MKMKRKYEESPSRKNKLSPSYACQKRTSTKESGRSNKNTTNNSNNVLRRSTRKATIERRVWAEPRREKQNKLPKNLNNIISRRGRPKKKSKGSKIFTKSSSNVENLPRNQLKPIVTPSKNILETVSVETEIAKGTSTECNEAELFGSPSEKTKEGTLVIDDQLSSLHGAIVDEVIADYPFQVSKPLVSNNFQKHLTAQSDTNNYVDDDSVDKWNANLPLNLSISSKSSPFHNVDKNVQEAVKSNPVTSTPKAKYLKTRSPPSSHILNTYNETFDSYTENKKEHIKQNVDNQATFNNGYEEKKDDNHVSLSEALAKLVDSEESGHGSELETVTIHPYNTADDIKHAQSVIKVHDNVSVFPVNSSSSNATMIIPANSRSHIAGAFSQTSSFSTTDYRENTIKDTEEKESLSASNSLHSDETTQSFKSLLKNPVPSLIKLSQRSPVIKTPLKCSECPMRFCTVRSLLWHFGTHEPFRKNVNSNEVVLEDLLASWDRPDIPVQILKRKDNDENCKVECDAFSECKYFPFENNLSVLGPKSKTQRSNNKPKVETSRDFILKVPVPRLMHKSLRDSFTDDPQYRDCDYSTCTCPSSPASPFVSIVPQPLAPSSVSENFAGGTTQIATIPETSTDANSMCTISSTCQRPIMTSASVDSSFNCHPKKTHPILHSSLQERQRSESCSEGQNSVTVIPVEELGKFRRQIQNESSAMKDEYHSRREHSQSNLLEEDGLVVINSGLALRIVSSSPSEDVLNSRDRSPGCLTILPQNKNTVSNTQEGSPPPDILTIVPQSKSGKNNCMKSSPSPSPQLMTAVGKVSADASPVVKLILVPPKVEVSSSTSEKNLDEGWESSADKSDDESEEGEMVIDMKEEEEASMDPLSLCSVTMEDEFNETNNPSNQLSLTSPSKSSKCSLDIKLEPCSNQESCKRPIVKLDEEKYLKRKYVCGFCQKRFGWSTDLKRHVILHTGERPFKCKWCPITFTRKFLLQNHMKKFHSQNCKWSDLWE